MVAISGAGFSPARFIGWVFTLVRPAQRVEREPRPAMDHVPPLRSSFMEQASMSREMHRL